MIGGMEGGRRHPWPPFPYREAVMFCPGQGIFPLASHTYDIPEQNCVSHEYDEPPRCEEEEVRESSPQAPVDPASDSDSSPHIDTEWNLLSEIEKNIDIMGTGESSRNPDPPRPANDQSEARLPLPDLVTCIYRVPQVRANEAVACCQDEADIVIPREETSKAVSNSDVSNGDNAQGCIEELYAKPKPKILRKTSDNASSETEKRCAVAVEKPKLKTAEKALSVESSGFQIKAGSSKNDSMPEASRFRECDPGYSSVPCPIEAAGFYEGKRNRIRSEDEPINMTLEEVRHSMRNLSVMNRGASLPETSSPCQLGTIDSRNHCTTPPEVQLRRHKLQWNKKGAFRFCLQPQGSVEDDEETVASDPPRCLSPHSCGETSHSYPNNTTCHTSQAIARSLKQTVRHWFGLRKDHTVSNASLPGRSPLCSWSNEELSVIQAQPASHSSPSCTPFLSRALPPVPSSTFLDHAPQGGKDMKTEQRQPLQDFATSIEKVKDYGWYWGPISGELAEKVLADEPDGSFIVRDSSDEHYIFSLTFKLNGFVRHVRIEQDHGNFSFGALTNFRSHTIVDFIENAIAHSRSGRYLFFLHRRPALGPMQVQLLHPVSRFKHVQSLQHMCRFVVLKLVRRDLIRSLPLPQPLLDYLSAPQYYSELANELDWCENREKSSTSHIEIPLPVTPLEDDTLSTAPDELDKESVELSALSSQSGHLVVQLNDEPFNCIPVKNDVKLDSSVESSGSKSQEIEEEYTQESKTVAPSEPNNNDSQPCKNVSQCVDDKEPTRKLAAFQSEQNNNARCIVPSPEQKRKPCADSIPNGSVTSLEVLVDGRTPVSSHGALTPEDHVGNIWDGIDYIDSDEV